VAYTVTRSSSKSGILSLSLVSSWTVVSGVSRVSSVRAWECQGCQARRQTIAKAVAKAALRRCYLYLRGRRSASSSFLLAISLYLFRTSSPYLCQPYILITLCLDKVVGRRGTGVEMSNPPADDVRTRTTRSGRILGSGALTPRSLSKDLEAI
jgi:hypothetical protein